MRTTHCCCPSSLRHPQSKDRSTCLLQGNQCDQPEASPTGVIRLQLAKGQVSIEGLVDPEVLRKVVQCLSQ
ncbi:protein of unknown function (plasmid) [Cupriavidus taiwanensis]|uniref:Uncharacterized protein n=1 Tax=Cupriavidus taiwanensis TaxID=164546 RepID=A0A9Q7V1B1_9BURK|nr:protein of unknown function [Cupriavidus taiwanensis]